MVRTKKFISYTIALATSMGFMLDSQPSQADVSKFEPPPVFHTYYVSAAAKAGGDGRSWKSAWKGLDKINWSVIEPGAVISIDGGTRCMIYDKPLLIGTDGTQELPIVIRTGFAPGHNGQVIINGASSANNSIGIDIGGHKHIYIQGSALPQLGIAAKSIRVCNFRNCGIYSNRQSEDICLQNVEVDHNGTVQFVRADPPDQPALSPPDAIADTATVPGRTGLFRLASGTGVSMQGNRGICDRLVAHNNAASNIFLNNSSNTTVSSCWLFNYPQELGVNNLFHPLNNLIREQFKDDTADGIHIQGAYSLKGYNMQNCILGPNLHRGVRYYQRTSALSMTNCLFIDPQSSNLLKENGGIDAQLHLVPSRMELNKVTSFMPPRNRFGQSHACLSFSEGRGDSVSSSVFWGGVVDVTGSSLLGKHNTQFKTSGNTMTLSAAQVNPKFRAILSQINHFSDEISADFKLRPDSPAVGTGSAITSVRQLLRY